MQNRIRKIRKELKLTQVEFGSKLGVAGNTITNYENGLREPSNAVLLSICRTFDVNETWLRTGSGEMFTPKPTNLVILEYFNKVAGLDDEDFKKKLALALANMSDEGWELVEKFIDSLK